MLYSLDASALISTQTNTMQLPLLLSCLVVTVLSASQPNLVFILTDDLDSVLDGLEPLAKTRRWISDQGVTLSKAFVSTPVCCPSRSTILTGQYQHNTKVLRNSVEGNCASPKWQRGPETRTFATFLKSAGYVTFYGGKYLNQYGHEKAGGPEYVPPGWDSWAGLVGNSKYYNYTLSVNGVPEHHGSNYSEDYLTDVISKKANDFLDKYMEKNTPNPFLMMLSTPSPHEPFTPAPQYAHHFSNLMAPRTNSFNYVEEPGREKHWLINTLPRPMDDNMIDTVDEAFRNRWRTLLSVDDLVDGLMTRLQDSGMLDNTYVIFTSDHGYHMGQFGLPVDKRQPYETDLRVPLLVRGPGIRAGWTCEAMTVSIDLAPTLLDMAGIPSPDFMDGTSFLPSLTEDTFQSMYVESFGEMMEPTQQHSFLVSYTGDLSGFRDKECLYLTDDSMSECVYKYGCKCQDARNNTFDCVRTRSDNEDTVYCVFDDDVGFVEMYNLVSDPDQLYNLAADLPRDTKDYYEGKIEVLKTCAGSYECFQR